MACTKITPCKKTGPKGVLRRQLALRSDEASSSRSNLQAKIERLSQELLQVSRDRCTDAIQIGELQGELERRTLDYDECQ